MKPNIRIGQGYDIHKLAAGRKLILGGVDINFKLGLDGHSDADVVCHSIMDAILGALALGDIGHHFPNTDDKYENAKSIELLKRVYQLMMAAGYVVGNLDITVIAEVPKIAPHINQMRRNISGILEIPENDISIKATTNEKLGTLGRGEGIAAFSVVLIYK